MMMMTMIIIMITKVNFLPSVPPGSIKKALKRRSAIEPEIGHMKNDGRLDRCYLKGAVGDAINVVMVAAGHNLRKLLNKLRLLWLKIIFSLMGSFIKPAQSAALNLA